MFPDALHGKDGAFEEAALQETPTDLQLGGLYRKVGVKWGRYHKIYVIYDRYIGMYLYDTI